MSIRCKKALGLASALPLVLLPHARAADGLQEIISQLKSRPYETRTLNEADNRALFGSYCLGDPESPAVPQPNYANPLVREAASRLSLSKTTADAALLALRKAQFAGILKAATQDCSTLVSSPIPEISAMGSRLAAEVAKATSDTGFTPETKALFDELSGLYVASLAAQSAELSEKLGQELKGVDYAELGKVIDALAVRLDQELAKVDFSELAAVTQNFSTALVSDSHPFDAQGVLGAMKTLDAKLASSGDDGVKNLLSTFQEVRDALAVNPAPSGGDSSVVNALDDVSSSLDDAFGASGAPQDEAVLAAISLLRSERADTHLLSAIQWLGSLRKALAEKQPATNPADLKAVRNLARNVVNVIEDVKASLGLSSGLQLKAFQAQMDRFSSSTLLASVKKAQSLLKSGDKSAALEEAGSLAGNLADSHLLSMETEALVTRLNAELAKQGTEEILAAAAKLHGDSLAAKGKLTDELTESANSLRYPLENVVESLSPALQQISRKFIQAQDGLLAASALASSLEQGVGAPQSEHFYFYGGVAKLYGVGSGSTLPASVPSGTEAVAHSFLTQLCGEYRDRATLIEAKLRWASNLFILPKSGSKTFGIDPARNVWSQIPAAAYSPYIRLTHAVWQAKRKANARYIEIGAHKQIDNPVPGFTVCETKYIFSEYVGTGKAFDSYPAYEAGFEQYRSRCSAEDQADYYDFRGDSNFKHYSPESNGMIWHATSIARACKSPTAARANQNGYTDEDCRKYFTQPFHYRYSAARAGLATWLYRADEYAPQFASQGSMVAIYPHNSPDLAPFSFSFDYTATSGDLFGLDPKWLSLDGAWNSSDIGYNQFTGLGGSTPDPQVAYERIRDAVDRHTDWYASGYNDRNGTAKNQAYSPFVASSYEMSASDNFTSCGTTVPCPDDGLRRWMFVFRIKPENWFTPARILRNEKVDFDRMWFDETSFGESNLADSEKAWDRLGTPSESEFDSILYLVNVPRGGDGEEDGDGDVEPGN